MKKKSLAVLLASIFVVLVLGGVFVFALRMYLGKGLSLITEQEGSFSYNGKILVSSDGKTALLPDTVGRTEFLPLELQSVDLSEFGFEGESFSYFERTEKSEYGVTTSVLYATSSAYEPFWPVCSRDRFVYLAADGEKYAIHPKEGLCYPIFSDSIEGVDPYGKDVLGFSADASFAIALSGTRVLIYHTDPSDSSLRIVDVKEVDLKEYGSNPKFESFVGNKEAYFSFEAEGKTEWVALDCAEGWTAKSALDPKGEYSSVIDRLFVERFDRKEEETDLFARWSHILLGTERTSPKLKDFESISLFAISPEGKYAIGKAEGKNGEEILVMTEKRAFSLTSLLEEDCTVEKIDFVYENLIWVTLKNAQGNELSRCYKICF